MYSLELAKLEQWRHNWIHVSRSSQTESNRIKRKKDKHHNLIAKCCFYHPNHRFECCFSFSFWLGIPNVNAFFFFHSERLWISYHKTQSLRNATIHSILFFYGLPCVWFTCYSFTNLQRMSEFVTPTAIRKIRSNRFFPIRSEWAPDRLSYVMWNYCVIARCLKAKVTPAFIGNWTVWKQQLINISIVPRIREFYAVNALMRLIIFSSANSIRITFTWKMERQRNNKK